MSTPDVRQALAELVAVKDLKERYDKLCDEAEPGTAEEALALEAEYRRRKPIAWANARDVLAEQPASVAEGWQLVRSSAVDWLRKYYPTLCEKSGLLAAAPKPEDTK